MPPIPPGSWRTSSRTCCSRRGPDSCGHASGASPRAARTIPIRRRCPSRRTTGIDRAALLAERNDARFGPATRKAVQQYQRTHTDALGRPLDDDGRVGPLTLGAMDASLGLPVIPPALAPEGKGDPCDAQAAHGFAGVDGEVVSTVSAWIKARAGGK